MDNVRIGDKVIHRDFGKGEVVRLNMSGPIVKFEDYDNEMCCPEYELTPDNAG